MKKFKYLSIFLAIIIIGLAFSGCSNQTYQTDTTVEVTYTSELSPEKIAEGESLTVAQFKDDTEETGIGGAKNPIGNIAMRYTTTNPVGKIVRDTLAEQLEKRGFKVEKMGLWDLNPENIKTLKTDLAMGGSIETFWTENRPDAGQYSFGGTGFSEVSLYIVLVKPETGEQVWIGEVTGGVTRSKAWGTPSFEEMLNVSFSAAIDQLLTSSDFKKAVKNLE